MNFLYAETFEVEKNRRCAVRRIGYSIDVYHFQIDNHHFFIELLIQLKIFAFPIRINNFSFNYTHLL